MDRAAKRMQAIDRKSSENVMRQGNVPLLVMFYVGGSVLCLFQWVLWGFDVDRSVCCMIYIPTWWSSSVAYRTDTSGSGCFPSGS